MTVTAVNGVAVFSGLTLNAIASGYQFSVSVDSLTASSGTFGAIANPTPASGTFYPGTSDQSLRGAISAADSNGFASNTIYLEAGTYTLTNGALGQLVIDDTAIGVASKTLTIIGQGAGADDHRAVDGGRVRRPRLRGGRALPARP